MRHIKQQIICAFRFKNADVVKLILAVILKRYKDFILARFPLHICKLYNRYIGLYAVVAEQREVLCFARLYHALKSGVSLYDILNRRLQFYKVDFGIQLKRERKICSCVAAENVAKVILRCAHSVNGARRVICLGLIVALDKEFLYSLDCSVRLYLGEGYGFTELCFKVLYEHNGAH